MKNLAVALITGVLFFIAPAAVAMPCFDRFGQPVGAIGTACNTIQAPYKNTDGEILAIDVESKATLFTAYAAPEKSKKDQRFGIKDAAGNPIGPAMFTRVYVVSRTMGVGSVPTSKYHWQEFLIDLTTGQIRPTIYTEILMTKTERPEQVPFLLGALPMTASAVSVLSPSGADTGLVFTKINRSLHYHVHNLALTVSTYSAGILRTFENYQIGYVNLKGEPPAEGRVLKPSTIGLFVETGPAPKEVRGAYASPLTAPLDAFGNVRPMPEGVLGMVHGIGMTDWHFVRSTPKGIRLYPYNLSSPPDLDAVPTEGGLLAVNFTKHTAVWQTADGWTDGGLALTKNEADAVAASNKRLDDFGKQVLAEVAQNEALARKREIEAKAERERTAATARVAARAAVAARIKQAKAESWSGYRLRDLEQDAMGTGLEDEYYLAGLYMSDDFRRQTCLWKRAMFCQSGQASSNTGSGFTSTWEQAFKNASALNQSQYRENCAAAFQGASRTCVVN
ncbi:MAG: hypothetical protein QM667_00435 [Asticcacaulis sp.]